MLEKVKKQPTFFRSILPWISIVALWAAYIVANRMAGSAAGMGGLKFAIDNGLILLIAGYFLFLWCKAEDNLYPKLAYILLSIAHFSLFTAATVYNTTYNIFHFSRSEFAKFWSSVDDLFFTWYLVFGFIAFLIVLLNARIKARSQFIFYIPIILIAILLIAISTYGIQWNSNSSSVVATFYNIVERVLEILVIVAAFFCIAASRNEGFSYVSIGFFISIATELVLAFGVTSQNYGVGSVIESGWVLGELLILYGVILLYKTGSFKTINQWLLPADSIRAQTSYWYFVISALLITTFLFLAKLVVPSVFSFNKQWLPILPTVLIVYTVFAVILCNLVAKRFSRPFQKLQDMIEDFQRTEKIDPSSIKDEKLYLAEFKQLQGFLAQAFSVLQERHAADKACHVLASQVAHDIRSALASLLIISKTCDDMPEEQRVAIREAAANINGIVNNLLNKYNGLRSDP